MLWSKDHSFCLLMCVHQKTTCHHVMATIKLKRKTRKHSSRMRTTCFSHPGGLLTEKRRNMGPGTETPLEGTWDQAARQEVTSYRDPLWTDRHL